MSRTALPAPIEITVLAKVGGPLTKRITLAPAMLHVQDGVNVRIGQRFAGPDSAVLAQAVHLLTRYLRLL